MARGVNKVILVGNLGQDPETKYTQSGGAVVSVSLATTDSWRDRTSGQQQERTEWHRIVFFGKVAEIAGQYLRKGSQIYVEGRLQTRKWQGQDGQDRYTTEVVVNDMQMLGGRGGGQGQSGDYNDAPAYGQQTQQQPQQAAPRQQAPASSPQWSDNSFGQQSPAQQPPRQAPQQPPMQQGGQQGGQQSGGNDAGFDDDIPF